MDLVSAASTATRARLLCPLIEPSHFPRNPCGVCSPSAISLPKMKRPCLLSLCSTRARIASLVSHAKRRGPSPQLPPPRQNTLEEEEYDDDDKEGELAEEEDEGLEYEFGDDFEDEIVMEDDEDFEVEFEDEELEEEEDEANLLVGDGGAGGGISLAGTWWEKEALAIAKEVSMSFDGDLKVYAFKTTVNFIRVRIEKLSTKSCSPSMDEIEAFSKAYRSRLDEAELAGTIPNDITLEVSSPGLERVVHIPEELERFKERPMYVRYVSDDAATASPREHDGVFRLISYDMELGQCTWGIADVKINRQKAGKGRPLGKKQREWRLQTPFESLRLVRLHSDF